MITVLEKKYVIVGVIEYVPPLTDEDIGHYVANIKLNDQWQCYDDLDSSGPKKAPAKANKIIHALMYVCSTL